MTGAPGWITTSDGFAYHLTAEDEDWASRLIANEGGDPAADLWTMAQRYVLLHRAFPTFKSMLSSFSQPLNPRWAVTGDFCAPGSRYFGQPECSGDKLAHRAVAQAPNTHYPDQLAYVERWAAGGVPNPVPRATDFRAADAQAQHLVDSGQMQLVLASGNWYFSTSDTENWPGNYVRVGGTGTASTSPHIVPLVLLGGAGLAIGAGLWYAHHEGKL